MIVPYTTSLLPHYLFPLFCCICSTAFMLYVYFLVCSSWVSSPHQLHEGSSLSFVFTHPQCLEEHLEQSQCSANALHITGEICQCQLRGMPQETVFRNIKCLGLPWSGKIPHTEEQLSLCTITTDACGPIAHALQQEKPPQ